jgi:GNAT superfamily N-acetyltransferase
LLERWLTGWSRSRGLPLPREEGGGLRVDVDWPGQLRRHVFVDAGAALQACAANNDIPFIHLKAAVAGEQLRAVLPAGWSLAPQGYLMACPGPMAGAAPLPPGYHATLAVEHGAWVVTILDATGELAATGRITVDAATAVYDRIETVASHRRRGLASAVMGALDRLAVQAGVLERLLVATEAGARLYPALGWRHVAPWSTAVRMAPAY